MGPLAHLQVRVTANQYNSVLSGHRFPMVKHFYSVDNGLFQDDKGDGGSLVKKMQIILCLTQSTIFSPHSLKHLTRECLFEKNGVLPSSMVQRRDGTINA